MSTKPSLLELKVMNMLLTGTDPTLQILAEQFHLAQVAGRELTGVGFYTTFTVPAEAPRLKGNKSFRFGDVEAQIEGLEHGAGFLLHVRDGAIECLEGYSYDEPWPTTTDNFRLFYSGKGERDFSALRQKWSAGE